MIATTPAKRVELTVRGLILGALITVVFTAANVFLGLKVGLTFASSIPAAVISMAVLRGFSTATIWENNIVQTVASSAGTLSSIIFVLPGLVMIGWWTGFPFWTSFLVCALGGILGVMYSIPLRRALVTQSTLPYPEGVAAAEVLKVGSGSRGDQPAAIAEGKAGLAVVVMGSVVAAGLTLVTATKVLAAEVVKFFKVGAGVSSAGTSFSLALFGAGHLVGITVGVAMFIGVVIAWAGATPYLVSQLPHPLTGDIAALASDIWRTKVRFMGAGAIGVAALWTLGRLVVPIGAGLASALAAQKKRGQGDAEELPLTERDIPIGIVAGVSIVALAPIAWLLWGFLQTGGLRGDHAAFLIGGSLIYIVVVGFLVAAICGYMAGLIGSSNSPLSGVGILAVLGASLLLLLATKTLGVQSGQALVAYALFTTSIVFAVATIANDNLQDLKTGQLVEATPWKQQVALVFGVIAGALIIPLILELLNTAYGFTGAPNAKAEALAAPQATLISSLAVGVLNGKLDWNLIFIGAGMGAVIVLIDEVLRLTGKLRLPPLAVGIGIYLPMTITVTVAIGALVGWIYDKQVEKGRHAEILKRMGVLLASGLIVGESLMGIAIAALVVVTGKQEPIALVGETFEPIAGWLGAGVFAVVVVLMYLYSARKGRQAGAAVA